MAAATKTYLGKDAGFEQILERLLELPNYVWDIERTPFHSVCVQHCIL
jgi:hypothetical protein